MIHPLSLINDDAAYAPAITAMQAAMLDINERYSVGKNPALLMIIAAMTKSNSVMTNERINPVATWIYLRITKPPSVKYDNTYAPGGLFIRFCKNKSHPSPLMLIPIVNKGDIGCIFFIF